MLPRSFARRRWIRPAIALLVVATAAVGLLAASSGDRAHATSALDRAYVREAMYRATRFQGWRVMPDEPRPVRRAGLARSVERLRPQLLADAFSLARSHRIDAGSRNGLNIGDAHQFGLSPSEYQPREWEWRANTADRVFALGAGAHLAGLIAISEVEARRGRDPHVRALARNVLRSARPLAREVARFNAVVFPPKR